MHVLKFSHNTKKLKIYNFDIPTLGDYKSMNMKQKIKKYSLKSNTNSKLHIINYILEKSAWLSDFK